MVLALHFLSGLLAFFILLHSMYVRDPLENGPTRIEAMAVGVVCTLLGFYALGLVLALELCRALHRRKGLFFDWWRTRLW